MSPRHSLNTRQVATGEQLYTACGTGSAWLILSGSVRLDRAEDRGEATFAGIALKGDILGAETLLLGNYSYTATALSECVLTPWPGAETQPEAGTLLKALAAAERRCADAIALRCGDAAARVRRLVGLLAGRTSPQRISRFTLPSLRDMADITALTVSTVSRTLVNMQDEGVLEMQSKPRGRPRST